MKSKILIANRGEIARRIIRTARAMGFETVAVYSEADRDALHVREADEAFYLGPAEAQQSYLNGKRIIEICKEVGAEYLHPGYGFLSENAPFAQALSKTKTKFIGPPASVIKKAGDKLVSKKHARKAKVPVLPDLVLNGDGTDSENIETFLFENTFPLIVKAAGGGGGRGMRIVHNRIAFEERIEAARKEAKAFFNDDRVFIEKALENTRHIEVQIASDTHGNVIAIGTRDCSLQRNHQKVIEEAPAPNLTPLQRMALHEAAVQFAKGIGYQNLGTVEFLMDENGEFYFLEMNSRLQVEHPVTELVWDIDLVELQIQIASGKKLETSLLERDFLRSDGTAIEVRLNAEEPRNDFQSGTGAITEWYFPSEKGKSGSYRLDAGFSRGAFISHYYDSLLAKLIVYRDTREEARRDLLNILERSAIGGVETNRGYLMNLLRSEAFESEEVTTQIAASYVKDSPGALLLAASLSLLNQKYRSVSFSSPWGEVSEDITRTVAVSGQVLTVTLVRQSQATFLAKGDSDDVLSLSIVRSDDNWAWNYSSPIGSGTVRFEEEDWVHLHFGSYTVKEAPPALKSSEKLARTQMSTLTSPLPGKVLKIFVEAGSEVREGDVLLCLESMKMEHSIQASGSGVVTEVHCLEGEIVQRGQVLVGF